VTVEVDVRQNLLNQSLESSCSKGVIEEELRNKLREAISSVRLI
jgi:hypothetical protein